MFFVIQKYDWSGDPLDVFIERMVYAVDHDSESFLVVNTMTDEFMWMPMSMCRATRRSKHGGVYEIPPLTVNHFVKEE